tara:strand:- start:696 stop:836 length:141 start_codon:yes stop_codon:yes gene_type:complete
MNNWDKVEKSRKVATQQDINTEYIKTVLWIISGIAYFYFVILGMSI